MPVPIRTAIMTLVAAFIFGLGLGGFTVMRDRLNQQARATAAGGVAERGTNSTPSTSATPSSPAAGKLRLTAQASQASGGSFTISGGLSPARSGVRLVVQRLEDGQWRTFPATTTTSGGGSYRVALRTGRKGENAFRIVAPGAGTPEAVSNEIRVTGA